MGTGIVAVLLHDLPYNARWLHWLSISVFILNVVLFGLFLAVSLARYIIWPGSWTAMIRHPEQSLFPGAIPISLGTIVSMICYVCVDVWGAPVQFLAMTLWVIEVVLSIMCACFMPFLLISRTDGIDLSGLTARHLFPAVSCVVASASGSVVASVVSNAQHALWTIIISYVLWGIGVPMAMLTLVIYFYRLVIHKLPPRELLVSVFIPIGKLRSFSRCSWVLILKTRSFGPRRLRNIELRQSDYCSFSTDSYSAQLY
jgi:tellurite resistance protein TehA-like permease